ncbi:MAG: glycosyltransferase family 4 protein [Sedimentisphaerales bacterium]|nr:glycosyltransferase family 4 protein [Sedimentisphaerales bacterium]
MHILYIHQHFATPQGSTGTRSYEFARRWVKSGHKVTMITGHYDIGGLDLTKGRKQTIDGINVIIVGTRYSNKQSILRRIFSFLCFCFFSIIAGLRVRNVDVIYATSTPLTIGIPAMKLKWFKRIPFIFEVRDQWPEIPIELGVIKNRVMIRMLLWLEKLIYKQSSAIVALSPGMAEGIRKVVGDKKHIEVVPNSCDTDFFKPEIDGSQIREKYGWNEKFVLLHFGAMGRVNNLEFVLEAAQKLRDNKAIHFVLAGNGSQKETLRDKINNLNLNNVEILDAIPKHELADFVAACDVSLVTIANYKILERNSANKFFDSLSAGKPVLLNYSGWQRDILEDNKCGSGCDLCNLEQFIEKIQYLELHKDEIKQMGQNARKVALEQFSRDKLAASVLDLIEKQIQK